MSIREDVFAAFSIGIASARANLVPMLALQAVAVGLAVVHGLCPEFRSLFESMAQWHRDFGWQAPFLSQAFFCGFLPGVLLFAFRSIRPARPMLTVVAQSMWCGCFGVVNNTLFLLMAELLGDKAALVPVAVKAVFDQFVWTPLVVAPANAVFFFWIGRDFSLARVRKDWPHPFYRRLVLPNLVPNWIVWIPVSLAVFSFPYALQIHVNGLVCTFWTLMCLQIGKRT